MAHIAGVYGQVMWEIPLTIEPKLGLWQALVWAIQYEYYFRPKLFAGRFLMLAEFLSGCAEDTVFRTHAFENIEILLREFDATNLQKVRDDLIKLPTSPTIVALEQMVNKHARLVELEPVLSAIEGLWWLLDSKKEGQNRNTLAEARQKGKTTQLLLRLATMAVIICRNALSRYTYRAATVNNSFSDPQLQSAIFLAEFATHYSTGEYAVDAWKCHFLLTGLQAMRSDRLNPADFAQRLREKFNGKKQDGSIWSDMLALVTRCLIERRNSNKTFPEEAKKWVQVFASVDGLSEVARSMFLMEARLHGYNPDEEDTKSTDSSSENKYNGGSIQQVNNAKEEEERDTGGKKEKETGGEEDPLGFLNEDQRAKLLESMRSLRLDQMRTVLRRARGPLLAAISKALSDTSFDEILPPRRTFYVRSNNRDDSLVEVKKRLMSPDKDTQNKALLQLEQIARETTDKENGPIAREWLLFARARVQSLNKAVPLWREDYNKGIASWEEIWNLAVALVRSEDFIQALEVLKSGVKELNAPFSHLRFALKSNVDILQHAEIYNKATISLAVKFLLDNLTKLPLAECYLTWLLLANEVQEPIDYNKQLYIISIFQDILDRPIRILRPENQAEEVTIEDFENDFEGLLSIMQRLEDNYILEPHKERIGIKSKMLTTFLRTPQIVPKRVGLFVDYENLRPMLPVEMQTQPKDVGDILARHASKYGDVVCRWLCAAPRNIPDSADMSEGFQRAGFVVQFPRGRTGQLFPTENLTDFVLVECITFEMMHSKPDIYVIVSGDGDYFEKIMRLLEQGNSVHLISSANNMASRYRRLEQRSQQYQLPEDYGGFFIDNLNEILQTKLVSQ